MCEILLCVHDMRNCPWPWPQQGDVITVREDSSYWSPLLLGQVPDDPANGRHSQVRIIKLPNVTVAQASNLLAGEKAADPLNPSNLLQYRQFFFDKSKIPAQQLALLANLADDLRVNGFITVNFTAAQLSNIVSMRQPLAAIPT